MADLAVIIVSYNSARWLNACLASVYAHAGNVGLEVVVVDNASSDASVDVVEREFPDVRVVRNENRGFAHGNNRGFETVDAPFVLFLNPDTEIRTGTFETLLSYLREHPSVGLLGCRQLDGLGDLCHTIRRFPSPLRYLLEAVGSERFRVRASWMGERELDLRAYDRETECDWVAGSFMLAPACSRGRCRHDGRAVFPVQRGARSLSRCESRWMVSALCPEDDDRSLRGTAVGQSLG